MSDKFMSANKRSTVWLVAHREIAVRAQSKAFLVGTAVLIALVVAVPIALKAFGGSDTETTRVAVVDGSDPTLSIALPAAGQAIDQTITVERAANVEQARQLVDDGTVQAAVQAEGAAGRVTVKEELSDPLDQALKIAVGQAETNRQVAQLGGDPAQVNAAVAQATFEVTSLEPAASYDNQAIALGSIAGILIYIALLFAGQIVAQGVVEEKSSRVVEVLLATITPSQLMAGKVLGIGIIGLAQVLLVGGAGAIAGVATGALSLPVSEVGASLAWLIVWFILGYAFFALLFAAAGALVSRQEDVGGVVTPLLTVLIGGYVIGISVLPSDPDNTFVSILSLIPVFSPMLMPMRLAMGNVPVWEAALSVGLIVAMIPILVVVAGRIYRRAIVRIGARVSIKDALRA